MDAKIKKFLLELPKEKQALAMTLREIALSASPKIGETIKWGQLTFVYGKTNLAFIYTYKNTDYVNLGFMQAVELSDPKNLFEGTGKGMRHVKVYSEKTVSATQIKKWFKEAIKLMEA
jgi:hypothetical protein